MTTVQCLLVTVEKCASVLIEKAWSAVRWGVSWGVSWVWDRDERRRHALCSGISHHTVPYANICQCTTHCALILAQLAELRHTDRQLLTGYTSITGQKLSVCVSVR